MSPVSFAYPNNTTSTGHAVRSLLPMQGSGTCRLPRGCGYPSPEHPTKLHPNPWAPRAPSSLGAANATKSHCTGQPAQTQTSATCCNILTTTYEPTAGDVVPVTLLGRRAWHWHAVPHMATDLGHSTSTCSHHIVPSMGEPTLSTHPVAGNVAVRQGHSGHLPSRWAPWGCSLPQPVPVARRKGKRKRRKRKRRRRRRPAPGLGTAVGHCPGHRGLCIPNGPTPRTRCAPYPRPAELPAPSLKQDSESGGGG